MNDVLTDKQIEKHRKDLLKNISELEREGIPGGISVFGEQTFAGKENFFFVSNIFYDFILKLIIEKNSKI